MTPTVTTDNFGTYTDKTTGKEETVKRFTFQNSNGIKIQVITYGATITSISIPDKNGTSDDIVMGFNDIEGYLSPTNPYFGAVCGRVCNRIRNATFQIDGITYKLSANQDGKHMLHGGFRGFDKVNWEPYLQGSKLILSYESPDGEEGFPGNVLTNVIFELSDDNEFTMEFKATTTKPTYVNITSHSYFNLAGHNKGSADLYKHTLMINADQITETDEDSVTTGKLLSVSDTVFDLRVPTVLGNVINKVPGQDGFDNNFCISKGTEQSNTFVARVVHPPSGRVLEVYSNQPGLQLYTSNCMPAGKVAKMKCPCKDDEDKDSGVAIKGKDGNYYKHGALCLETQNYPNGINHGEFPKSVLYPGEVYEHFVVYKFLTLKN